MDGEGTLRLIDGNYVVASKVVARCHLLTHRGYLSKALIKSHDCIAKKCTFFEKLKAYYWTAIEAAEIAKKSNRLKRKQDAAMKSDRDILIRETLEDSGHIHVTTINDEKPNLLVISYIYDKRVNLRPEIAFLRGYLNMTIKLQARTGSEDTIEQLIRKRRRETRKVTDLRKAPKVGDAAKKRLATLGVYCLEDLYGRSGDALYRLDCEKSGKAVNKRYLTAYRSAVEYANRDTAT
jgi:hypothetical protein